jgi:hypothetical protein
LGPVAEHKRNTRRTEPARLTIKLDAFTSSGASTVCALAKGKTQRWRLGGLLFAAASRPPTTVSVAEVQGRREMQRL